MKKIFAFIIVAGTIVACSTNAVTGRKQLSLLPESQLQQMAVSEYQSFLSQSKVVNGTASKDAEMVRRVGTRISKAITDYYTQQGKGKILEGYKWEFNLVDNKEINAWCMPGGKVVVYTGLLPVAQNEAALAVVLGHEIAHAVASHCPGGSDSDSCQLLARLAFSFACRLSGATATQACVPKKALTFGPMGIGIGLRPPLKGVLASY